MSFPEAVSLRDQLWSPVQNTGLWMSWWLHGVIPADALIDAFRSVQGGHHRLIMDADSEPMCPPPSASGLSDVLRAARLVTEQVDVTVESRPLVQLALAGPGDVPPLPAGTEGAKAVAQAGAGLVLADVDPEVCHVLVPKLVDNSVVHWHWYRTEGTAPNMSIHSPGDADALLREAVNSAADGVHNSGMPAVRNHNKDPHLAVGVLSNVFGLPGLPPGVSGRAEKLMARADTVAAIVEVTRSSRAGAGLDPHVLPLLRAVRIARCTAVDYAQRELLR